MSRVKRGTTSLKRRRNVLRKAKGYQFGRSKKEVEAKVALRKAWSYQFQHRRDKKSDFRRLWSVQMNAALRPLGHSYSKFIAAAKKKSVVLDRKILAGLAEHEPETFRRVVQHVMG